MPARVPKRGTDVEYCDLVFRYCNEPPSLEVHASLFALSWPSGPVDLSCEAGNLAIEIGNDSPKDLSTAHMPRSIVERAMSLGGRVQVRLDNDGHDIVRVTTPLTARDHNSSQGARAPVRAA